MASLNANIVLISLPAVFRGIHINPLAPGSFSLFTVAAYGLYGSDSNPFGFFRMNF
jgi:hypothetical protein